MADRIYPAMHDVQPLRLDPPRDRSATDPQAEQLPASDHAMLRPGKSGDPLISSCPTFDIYLMLNVGRVWHWRSVAEAVLRVGHGRNVWAT